MPLIAWDDVPGPNLVNDRHSRYSIPSSCMLEIDQTSSKRCKLPNDAPEGKLSIDDALPA